MLSGISQKRSIRSSPYWFTEFCNSQCLSHFAAPFIVVRAETSVAESCVEQGCSITTEYQHNNSRYPTASRKGSRSNSTLLPPSFSPRALMQSPSLAENLTVGDSQWFKRIRANDPSAGSPTETLLRLLLPLSDKVH